MNVIEEFEEFEVFVVGSHSDPGPRETRLHTVAGSVAAPSLVGGMLEEPSTSATSIAHSKKVQSFRWTVPGEGSVRRVSPESQVN